MSLVPFLVYLAMAVFLVWLMSRPIRPRGVRVIHTRGLSKGYVPPSASLRGQDVLDRTPVPPEPPEKWGEPVVVQDVND